MIALNGGKVFTMTGLVHGDVLIDGGTVVAVGPDLEHRSAVSYDVSGAVVGPGLVDLHAHLREPGQAWKEDIETGSRAAAAGGYTAIIAMPNTDPPIDSPKIASAVLSRGREVGLAEVGVAAAITRGRSGMEVSDLEALYAEGVRLFTDDGDTVADPTRLAEAMRILCGLEGAVLAQHAEDPSMTVGGHVNEGMVAAMHGIGPLPVAAETSILERDLALVRETGVTYHAQHLSAAPSVDLIRAAKLDGLPVTAEVAPHHLTFDERALSSLDTNFKMYPPIRSQVDREALVAGLADGTIDVVATDHAPHSREEKDVAFEDAPRGVIGLETALSAVWEVLGDLTRLFEAMSVAPARVAGLSRQGQAIAPGVPANLVVFDPNQAWVAEGFMSKSSNSPYMGREMRGKVRLTVHEGRVTHEEGR